MERPKNLDYTQYYQNMRERLYSDRNFQRALHSQVTVISGISQIIGTVSNGKNVFQEFDSIKYPYRQAIYEVNHEIYTDEQVARQLAHEVSLVASHKHDVYRILADISRSGASKENHENLGLKADRDPNEAPSYLLNTRNGRRKMAEDYVPKKNLVGVINQGPTVFEMSYRSYNAFRKMFDYASKAPVTTQSQEESNPDVVQLKHAAYEEMVNYFLYMRDRGLPSDQVRALFYNAFHTSGIQKFFGNINSPELQRFVPGLFAEVHTALDYIDNGYTLKKTGEDDEQLGIDIRAVKPNGEQELVQIKGDYNQQSMDKINLRTDYPSFLHWVKAARYRRKYINHAEVLLDVSNKEGAEPIWVLAPTDYKRIVNTFLDVPVVGKKNFM